MPDVKMDHSAQMPAEQEADTGAASGRARILVVDDEPMNLEIIAEHLDDACYDLEFAGDGAEAWGRLDREPGAFDLVLLDRMMPVMDGMELLRKLKSDGRFRHLPVVMQTAAAAKDQVAEGLRQGAYYYLTKPFERVVLLAIVEAALEQTRIRGSLLKDRLDYSTLTGAEFSFRTLEEARRLAGFLARLTGQPDQAVLGLCELMINAIEHGNLEISYAEKSVLNEAGTWRSEVERRLGLPQYHSRRATAKFRRLPGRLEFEIRDDGPGFDWSRYLEMSPERAYDSHGRGIAMARIVSFSEVNYSGAGNIVTAVIAAVPAA
jgi:CheY-like chemotaxis protein